MDSTILRNCALVGGSDARDCNGQSEILSFVNIPLGAASALRPAGSWRGRAFIRHDLEEGVGNAFFLLLSSIPVNSPIACIRTGTASGVQIRNRGSTATG